MVNLQNAFETPETMRAAYDAMSEEIGGFRPREAYQFETNWKNYQKRGSVSGYLRDGFIRAAGWYLRLHEIKHENAIEEVGQALDYQQIQQIAIDVITECGLTYEINPHVREPFVNWPR